jgi:hypothetical protein
MPKSHKPKDRPAPIAWCEPVPTHYAGTDYPSRRKALRAKREAGDTSSPTLRNRENRK